MFAGQTHLWIEFGVTLCGTCSNRIVNVITYISTVALITKSHSRDETHGSSPPGHPSLTKPIWFCFEPATNVH